MNNKVTHEEILDFYKTFNSEEFQNQYKNISFNSSSLISNIILFCSIIGLAFISPFFLFGLAYPILLTTDNIISFDKNRKNLVETINSKISYKDFKKLKRSYDWTLLSYELEIKEKLLKENNNSEIKKEKVQNNPRSLNACIIEYDNNQNPVKEKNLIRKTAKRHAKQKVKDISRSLDCCIIKEQEDFKITYQLLSDFAFSVNCILVEFSKSINYQENKEYYVKLKNKHNRILTFAVTEQYFKGIYNSENDCFTENWLTYLSNQHKNSI